MNYLKLILLIFFLLPTAHASSAVVSTFNSTFATSDEAPANYQENEKLVGMSVDIVEEMIAQSKKLHDIAFYPWARAYSQMLKEENFFLFTGGRSQERIDAGIQFIGPLTTRNHLLLQLKNGPKRIIKSVADLKQTSIAGVAGDWRTTFFTSQGVEVYQVAGPSRLYQMLKRGHVDYIITSDFEINANALSEGMSLDSLELAWIFQTASGYLLTSKKTDPKLVRYWQDIYLKVAKSGKMQKRASYWSKKYTVPFRFTPEKGFYINW